MFGRGGGTVLGFSALGNLEKNVQIINKRTLKSSNFYIYYVFEFSTVFELHALKNVLLKTIRMFYQTFFYNDYSSKLIIEDEDEKTKKV